MEKSLAQEKHTYGLRETDTVCDKCVFIRGTRVFPYRDVNNWVSQARSKQCVHKVRSHCHCIYSQCMLLCRCLCCHCCCCNSALAVPHMPFRLMCCRCRQRMTRVGDLDSELETHKDCAVALSMCAAMYVYVCVCVREWNIVEWNDDWTKRRQRARE